LGDYPELLKLWVDGGFNGPEFAAWVQTQHPKLVVEVVKRLAEVPGFHVLPKRWVVERTFGWLMHCRRLVRDHEQTTASAAGWIYLAMTRLMLRRLA
jgi:putative transposase